MLDKNGFSRPAYDELVDQLIDKWHELFGDNANTATNSVGGIFIRIIAYILNRVYQLAELVYQSQFADSATGVTLDQLAANVGLMRKAPQTAMGSIKIYGVQGYEVPTGTQFKTEDGLVYVTSEPIMLNATGKKAIELNEAGYGTITYNDHFLGMGESHLLYAYDSGLKYNKPSTYPNYPAESVTPVEEVLAVEVEKINGGSDLETDDLLRERIEHSTNELPSSPYNGVLSAINNVVGVTAVKIIANDTMQADKDGNPAKTLHIYVDGGLEDDIGDAIFDSVAAGVQTYGTRPVPVKDIAGLTHTVYYDRPVALLVHAHIKLTVNDEYPIDGDMLVKQAVIAYVATVPMGDAVRYSFLYQAIYDKVPGIVVADVKIGPDDQHLAAQDIGLMGIQNASCTSDLVVIEK